MSRFSLFPNPQTRTARMTTRQHLSSQSTKATTCFVLDDCDDDSETFANMVDGRVSLSMEPTKRKSPTPIAFNAVDTEERNILNIQTSYDDDGPRSGGDEHKSDQNTRCNNYTCRGMLSGDVLRDYQKQYMSLSKVGNASTDVYEFLLCRKNFMALTQRYLFLSEKQTTRAQVGKNGCLARTKKGTSSERSPRFVARFENGVVQRDWTQIPVSHDLRRRHTVPIVETILPCSSRKPHHLQRNTFGINKPR